MAVNSIALQSMSQLTEDLTPPSLPVRLAVDAWLQVPLATAHVAAELASSMTHGSRNFGEVGLTTPEDLFNFFQGTLNNGKNDVLNFYNEMCKLSADCNIEGIPIKTSKLTCDRELDVSTAPVISQATSTRDQVMINATPKARVFELTGYLTPYSAIDQIYLIKPTLLMQIDFLDAVMQTRRPVWFKDDKNRFFKCQLTSFHYEHSPDATTAIPVTMKLQEFIAIETTAYGTGKLAQFIGKVRQNGLTKAVFGD